MHGPPTERNAHPHFTDGVAVVHNGIIENFAELKDELAATGAEFQTDTDTEVLAHLLARHLRRGMEKEIVEQPEVIADALGHYISFIDNGADAVFGIDFARIPSLAISACGTAYLAGLIGKYWFERYARLPVEIDVASEFRYREIPLSPQSAALFISQSGETADTLASLRYCKQLGLKIGAVVNARESTIAREADAVFPILAGPEIGVASTKAFTCQLAVLAALAIHAAKARGTVTEDEAQALVESLTEMPRLMRQVLGSIQPQIELLSRELSKCDHGHRSRPATQPGKISHRRMM